MEELKNGDVGDVKKSEYQHIRWIQNSLDIRPEILEHICRISFVKEIICRKEAQYSNTRFDMFRKLEQSL